MPQDTHGFATILSLVRTTALKALGKPGAEAGAALAGGTASGPPTAGQFEVDDVVLDATGTAWVCVAAGTPGAWAQGGSVFATATATTISPGVARVDHSTTPVASLWRAVTPGAINSFTGGNSNYGQEFYSDTAGLITQLSFYKGSSQVGTHTAGLYDKGTGLLLGSTTFTGETASGWQSQALIPPVPITAATHYVVAIHEPSTFISYTSPAPTPSSGLHIVGSTTYDFNASLDFPVAQTSTGNVWAIDLGFVPPMASLWQAATPGTSTTAGGLGANANYGNEWYSDTTGYVTAILFHKGASDTGTHIGSLYDKTSGAQLAQVTFAGETASGWQTQPLAAPLPVYAGVHYVVALHTQSTNFSWSTTASVTSSSGLHLVGNTTFDLNTPVDNPTASTSSGNTWAIDVGFQAPGGTANTVMTNPMTTAGDLIYGAVSGISTRLTGGTASQVLAGGATPAFGTVPSAALTSVPAASLTGSHTLPDSTLSTNVPLLNAADTFTAEVTATDFKTSGLTGATAATRYVGGTVSAAPASGTFAVGDYVITQSGSLYICTTAGTPGTWTQVSGGGGGSGTLATATDATISSAHDGDLLVYRSSDSTWHNYQPYATGTVRWEPLSDVGGNLLVDNTGATLVTLVANTG